MYRQNVRTLPIGLSWSRKTSCHRRRWPSSAAAGSRPSSPSGHAPSPSRRAAGQPPRPWRCASSSSSSSPAYVRAVLLPWLWPSPSLSCTGYICMSLRMLRMETRWGATCARTLAYICFYQRGLRCIQIHDSAQTRMPWGNTGNIQTYE